MSGHYTHKAPFDPDFQSSAIGILDCGNPDQQCSFEVLVRYLDASDAEALDFANVG